MSTELQPPLPTPRALLTSLFNTLALSPQTSHQTTDTATIPSTTSSSTNPLKSLPPPHRALLTTLHVLLPPPTLLQALDLLDRGLVTRLRLSTKTETVPPIPPITAGPTSASLAGEKEKATSNAIYIVSTSQPLRSRSQTKTYTVHLRAWNCTCAAFAFAAFPASSSSEARGLQEGAGGVWLGGEGEGEGWGEDGQGLEFGGLCLDGRDGGEAAIPVCKHLLACFLSEKLGGVFGGFAKEREVGREEMAGCVVGGG